MPPLPALAIVGQVTPAARNSVKEGVQLADFLNSRRLGSEAPGGNEVALGRLAGINPQAAESIQNIRASQASTAQGAVKAAQTQRLDGLRLTKRILDVVAGAEPNLQPALYRAGLQRLQQAGVNLAGTPQEFDPAFIAEQRSLLRAFQDRGGFEIVKDPAVLRRFQEGSVVSRDSETGPLGVVQGPANRREDGTTLPGGQTSFDDQGNPNTAVAEGTPLPKFTPSDQSQGADPSNVGTSNSLTKPTQAQLEEDQIKTANQLARVKDIGASFKPEFLEIGTKFDAAFAAGKEKLGFELSANDKKFLTEFSTFKRRSIDNVNKSLNELLSAVVSPEEAKSIRSSLPDAGDGILDGDSPTQFKAKLDDVTKQLKLAFARQTFARKQGLVPLTISIEQMEARIEQRGKELFRQVSEARPDLARDAIMLDVRQRLVNEFGDLR